jgi:hypothetical protein
MNLLPALVSGWFTGIAGILIAFLEAIQQMNQYSTLWLMYRSTAERLKHERYLLLAQAGPYRGLSTNEALVGLAERVEEHVSSEHANWFNEGKRKLSNPNKDEPKRD